MVVKPLPRSLSLLASSTIQLLISFARLAWDEPTRVNADEPTCRVPGCDSILKIDENERASVPVSVLHVEGAFLWNPPIVRCCHNCLQQPAPMAAVGCVPHNIDADNEGKLRCG